MSGIDALFASYGADSDDSDHDPEVPSVTQGGKNLLGDFLEHVPDVSSVRPKAKGRPKKAASLAMMEGLENSQLLEGGHAPQPIRSWFDNADATVIALSDLLTDPSCNDEDYKVAQAVKYRLQSTKLLSKMADGERAGLLSWAYAKLRIRLAACLQLAEAAYRAALEQFVLNCFNPENVVLYLDGPVCHDEMTLSMSFAEKHQRGQKKLKTTAPCKVLQTQTSFSMVVETNGELLMLSGSAGNQLQFLETTSAECILKALLDNSTMSREVERCPFKVRLACTDSHRAVKKAERAWKEVKEGEWLSLHLSCEAHLAATCFSGTFEIAAETTRKMLHVALAVRSCSGASNSFRTALAAVILDRLVIMHGVPSQDACVFRNATVNLFLLGRAGMAKRLAILSCSVNGDWRNRVEVQHYLQPGEVELSKVEVAKRITDSLLWALLPHNPVVFKTKTWGDADHSIADLGLLDSCHGLLEPSFALFCNLVAGRIIPDSLSLAEGSTLTKANHWLLAVKTRDVWGEKTSIGQTPRVDQPEESFSSVEKENHRRQGLEFMEEHRGLHLPELLLVAKPLAALLRNIMKASGNAYELNQRAMAILGPEAPLFRLGLAVDCIFEDECLEEIQNLLRNSSHWDVVHPDRRNVCVQQNIFRLLSRAGSYVQYLFKSKHAQYPFRLFQNCLHPEQHIDHASTPVCMLDSFSKSFLEVAGNDMLTAKNHARLKCILCRAKLDTCHVEVGHSRIRRRTVALSQNCTRQDIIDASADFVTNEYRRRGEEVDFLHGLSGMLKPKGKRTIDEASVEDDGSPRKKRLRGPWKTFLHLHAQHFNDRAIKWENPFGKFSFQLVLKHCSLSVLWVFWSFKAYQSLDVSQKQELFSIGQGSIRSFSCWWCFHWQGAEKSCKSKKERRHTLLAIMDHQGLNPLNPSSYTTTASLHPGLDALQMDTQLQVAQETLVTAVEVRRKFDENRRLVLHGCYESKLEGCKQVFLNVCPSVPSEILSSLWPGPTLASDVTALNLIHWWPDIGNMVTASLAMLPPSGKQKKHELLMKALEDWWREQHVQISHEQIDTCRQPAQPMSMCIRAGFCLHTHEGQVVRQCRDAFVKNMSSSFAKQSIARQQYLDLGRIVCKLWEDVADVESSACCWLHLAEVYWNPIHPLCQRLKYVQPGVCGETELQNMASMRVQWYELTTAERPIACIRPQQVYVKACALPAITDSECFWHKTERKHPKPRSQGERKPKQTSKVDTSNVPPAEAQGEVPGAGSLHHDPVCSDDEDLEGGTLDTATTAYLEELQACTEASVDALVVEPANVASEAEVQGLSGSASSHASPAAAAAAATPDLGAEGSKASRKGQLYRKADAEVVIGTGAIRFYLNKDELVAYCGQQGHGSCRLSRTCKQSSSSKRPGQGRPLGLLSAWLLRECEDADAHKSFKPSLDERKLARGMLNLCPDSDTLVSAERMVRDGEDDEPDVLLACHNGVACNLS
eukprot:499916-Amphidinium_carterae.2